MARARGGGHRPTVAPQRMSLVNVAYNISFGWSKPEVQSLEAQMLEPLLNEHPVELGLAGRQASVVDVLAADPEYRAVFAQAFPQDANAASGVDAGGGSNAGLAARRARAATRWHGGG